MHALAQILLAFAALFTLVGGILLLLSHVGLSRLPGDIVIHGRSFTLYMPLGLTLLLSVALTIVLNLFTGR